RPLAAHFVGDAAGGSSGNRRAFGLVIIKAPDFFWFPDEEKRDRRENRDDGAGDVNEVAIDVIRPEKLRDGERNADDENRGEYFESVCPADHRAHEPEGNDDRSERKNAADHRADVGFREPGNSGERVDGRSDRSPRDGRRVGDQIQRGGMERTESKADHERAGNRDRRSESRATLDKRAEAERNEENLQPAIGRDSRARFLNDFKLAGLDGNVVEEHGGEDDPRNFQNAKRHAISKSRDGEGGRHVKD